jgi:LuxR family maltose regulon positive regulatory protein
MTVAGGTATTSCSETSFRARLTDEQPDIVPGLHRRASDWYERDGDVSEAIRHALAGEDFERGARLIELAIPAMRQARQEVAVRGWLDASRDTSMADGAAGSTG